MSGGEAAVRSPGDGDGVQPPASPTILVVDDDRALVDLLAVVFETEGYLVRWAISGRDALAALEQAVPDVVLADEPLLRRAGSSLSERLLAQRVPVVLLDPIDVGHPALPGAGVVTTPPDIALLLALIARLLAQQGAPGKR